MARILVIDDEREARIPLRHILQAAGHEVEEASDGLLGLELYRRQPVDLVITDLMMPGKSGLEVIEELREEDPDAKVIAITAYVEEALLEAEALGADRTLLKAVPLQEILKAVEEVLEGSP